MNKNKLEKIKIILHDYCDEPEIEVYQFISEKDKEIVKKKMKEILE